MVALVSPASVSSPAALPSVVARALGRAVSPGFSGSRSVAPPPAVVAAVCLALSPAASPVVGCAPGVDSVFARVLPRARVFSVSGPGRAAFAARSVAVVGAASSWFSFPASPCPPALAPSASASRCFCGSGSGSWASLAFAVGSGLPSVLFSAVAPPASWGFVSLGGGWWLWVPPFVQPSLL